SDMQGFNVNFGFKFGPFKLGIGGGLTSGSDTGHMMPFDLNGDGLPDFLDDSTGININSLSVTGLNPTRFNVFTSDNLFAPLSHTNRSGWNFEGDLGASFKTGVGVSLAAGYARTSTED